MDFTQKRWTFVTFRLYYPLCVSRRVDTWHIVYLSYKDPCPKISVHKSENTEYFTETALCIPLAVAVQINKTLAAYVIEDGNVTAAFLLNWVARRGY